MARLTEIHRQQKVDISFDQRFEHEHEANIVSFFLGSVKTYKLALTAFLHIFHSKFQMSPIIKCVSQKRRKTFVSADF
jgi:hypothetical protein